MRNIHFTSFKTFKFSEKSDWSIQNRVMLDNMLFYVTKGFFYVTDERLNIRKKVSKGDFCLFPIWYKVNTFKETNHPFEVAVIHFSVPSVGVMDLLSQLARPMILHPETQSTLSPLMNLLLAPPKEEALQRLAFSQKKAYETMGSAFLLEFLCQDEIQKSLNQFNVTQFSAQIIKALHYIENHLYKKMSIQEIASELNMSESHFNKTFRQEMKTSPIKYINKQKISLALQFKYTNSQNLNWESISEKVGFTDVFYFFRVFKQVMGMPPKEYLKKEDI